ncbi:MAG: envelope stress response membrane protein PspB [Pseudomonadota bacterium]
MFEAEMLVALAAILSLFVILPGMVFHYITLWRKQRSLMPDDERMLEDLWRSAKRMERRIETLEALIETDAADRQPHPNPTESRRLDP